jgi:predicted RNA polymerase sigma factor
MSALAAMSDELLEAIRDAAEHLVVIAESPARPNPIVAAWLNSVGRTAHLEQLRRQATGIQRQVLELALLDPKVMQ